VAPLLFEPFRRLDGPAGSGPGTGLGLSIVRSVAIAHHGTVTARSRPAGGLEVAVLLPGAPAEAAGRTAEPVTAGQA
jgi:signal transduction histidine kinase